MKMLGRGLETTINVGRGQETTPSGDNMLQFSDANKDTLIIIAQQCPYYFGNAVYQARLLLSFCDTTQYYNDCELPEYQNGQKVIHPSSTDQTDDNFSVYPNPANDLITINNPTGNPAIIEIYDYIGKKVCFYKIDNPVNIISIKEFSSGLYIFRISSNGKLIDNNKLIILK